MSNNGKTIIRHSIAVLSFPKKINDFVEYAKTIYKAMNNNSNFPASAVTLTALKTDMNALDTSETALHTKPPTGTTAARDALHEKVKDELRTLLRDVQAAANANPAQAEVIIGSSAMSVKAINIHQKQGNTVKDSDVSVAVILTGDGGGPHEWQMSKDQTAITNLPATTSAKTTVGNLTPGDTWYFRNRPILRNGTMGDWCQWIKAVIL